LIQFRLPNSAIWHAQTGRGGMSFLLFPTYTLPNSKRSAASRQVLLIGHFSPGLGNGALSYRRRRVRSHAPSHACPQPHPPLRPGHSLPRIRPRLGTLVDRLAGHVVVVCCGCPLPLGFDRPAATLPQDPPSARYGWHAHRHGRGAHRARASPRHPYRCGAATRRPALHSPYFNGREDYLKSLLPPASGGSSAQDELLPVEVQMTTPDHVRSLEELASILRVSRSNGLTGGLTPRRCRGDLWPPSSARQICGGWQDASLPERAEWPGKKYICIYLLFLPHAFPTPTKPICRRSIRRGTPRLRRAAGRASLAIPRWCAPQSNSSAVGLPGTAPCRSARLAARPFSSGSPALRLGEISADMDQPRACCGCCIFECLQRRRWSPSLAMLTAVESGAQAALMAPTELLARKAT